MAFSFQYYLLVFTFKHKRPSLNAYSTSMDQCFQPWISNATLLDFKCNIIRSFPVHSFHCIYYFYCTFDIIFKCRLCYFYQLLQPMADKSIVKLQFKIGHRQRQFGLWNCCSFFMQFLVKKMQFFYFLQLMTVKSIVRILI